MTKSPQYRQQWKRREGTWPSGTGAGFEIWRSLIQILNPTAIWICSRLPRVQLLDRVAEIANWSASNQLELLIVDVI